MVMIDEITQREVENKLSELEQLYASSRNLIEEIKTLNAEIKALKDDVILLEAQNIRLLWQLNQQD